MTAMTLREALAEAAELEEAIPEPEAAYLAALLVLYRALIPDTGPSWPHVAVVMADRDSALELCHEMLDELLDSPFAEDYESRLLKLDDMVSDS